MVPRAWQGAMIGAARSGRLKRFMQGTRATSGLSRRFVAGTDAAAAVERARDQKQLAAMRASLFYMGEYVEQAGRIEEIVARKLAAADCLAEAGLDIHVSVDPTQIGYQIDPALLAGNAARIAARIAELAAGRQGVHCLMLDMEDAGVTGATIALHDTLRDEGYPVALTLQAYLRRTKADMKAQVAAGSRVRLVRGAFAERNEIAFTSRAEIKHSYRDLLDLMFSTRARETGFYPDVATHDVDLQDYALALAKANGWPKHSYEFELLLGVRQEAALALARRGERVRLYMPFGEDWWPYAVRRIGEYPGNAWLLFRALLG